MMRRAVSAAQRVASAVTHTRAASSTLAIMRRAQSTHTVPSRSTHTQAISSHASPSKHATTLSSIPKAFLITGGTAADRKKQYDDLVKREEHFMIVKRENDNELAVVGSERHEELTGLTFEKAKQTALEGNRTLVPGFDNKIEIPFEEKRRGTIDLSLPKAYLIIGRTPQDKTRQYHALRRREPSLLRLLDQAYGGKNEDEQVIVFSNNKDDFAGMSFEKAKKLALEGSHKLHSYFRAQTSATEPQDGRVDLPAPTSTCSPRR